MARMVSPLNHGPPMGIPLGRKRASVHELRVDLLVVTIDRLRQRIETRLPGRNLALLAVALREIAQRAAERSARFRKPHLPLRLLSGALVLGIGAALVYAKTLLRFTDVDGWDLLQGLDAAISTLVFLGAVVIFLFSMEQRIKREQALEAMQELRALAHIIDMHQLPKDPERTLNPAIGTAVSPVDGLTPFELGRYLDYCGELLSLIGKIAVIYVQGYQDPVVLSAVDEVEDLTNGLSRKIWQKIMILNLLQQEENRVARQAQTSGQAPRAGGS
jgi:hypothetical protein